MKYCNKCGKELRAGDSYCGGCGQKVGAAAASGKKIVWVVVLLCIALIIGITVGQTEKQEPEKIQPEAAISPVTQTGTLSVDTLPEEPEDGMELVDSDYSNGMPRRRVSGSTDKYVTDYRMDGTLLRDSELHYYDGKFTDKRITNYDAYGNPTDVTETMSDGTLWLYLFYINEYDEQGRPLILAEFNRQGNPLYIYCYTYNADGSCRMDWEEYRGAVYEYDFEYDPEGTTSLFSYGYTTFTAEGDVLDQMIYEG